MWRSELAKTALADKYQRYVWFAAWPLILLALFSSCADHSGSSAGPDTSVQDKVRAFGAGAILTYVTATPADGPKLAAVYGDELLKPPEGQQAIPLPRLNVLTSTAAAEPAGTPKDWRVYLTAITDTDTETYMVVVHVFDSGYRPLSLPGLQPGPAVGPAVTLTQGTAVDVNSDSAVAVTLRDFFDAWLAGKGDLGRVADTRTVAAFGTPPCGSVKVMAAYASEQIPQQPSGDLTVGATVWGMHTQNSQLSYTLKLTASAGRWIVTDIAATPPASETNSNSQTPQSGP